MDTIHATAEAGALRNQIGRLIDAGRTTAARPLLFAAQRLSPPSPDLSRLVARLALREGEWDAAMRELDTAIADAPTHAGLRKCRAEVRQLVGDGEGTVRDAAEAVVLDPSDAEAKAVLGVALLELDRTADAVACLTEAVAACPAAPPYRQALATAMERNADPNAALRVLTDGIAISTASVALRNAAILLCVRRRDFTQAVRLAEQARKVGIVDASTFGMKGHALASLGNHDQALFAYQEALKLAPDDPTVRHIVTSASVPSGARQAPAEYIRTMFDDFADRFEGHLTSLNYHTPSQVRAAVQAHPRLASGNPIGPVLDLGCGTGLVGLAISDLPLGPITGVDLSRRMLDHAAAKGIYAELREADIMAALADEGTRRWPLIVAADVLNYFGALEELLAAVHARLEPGGWFVFSTEQLQSDYDGNVPGNGSWALQRQGRYAHTPEYVHEAVLALDYRVLRADHHIIRREADAAVPGLLLVVERLRQDA